MLTYVHLSTVTLPLAASILLSFVSLTVHVIQIHVILRPDVPKQLFRVMMMMPALPMDVTVFLDAITVL